MPEKRYRFHNVARDLNFSADHEHYQSVKLFESKSGPNFCPPGLGPNCLQRSSVSIITKVTTSKERLIYHIVNGACRERAWARLNDYVNKKGPYKSAQPHSLISIFVVHSL